MMGDTSVLPPSTNRGAEKPVGLWTRVDWLEGTFFGVTVDGLEHVLGGSLHEEFAPVGHGRWGYEYQRMSPSGAFILWSERPRKQGEGMGVHFGLPGKACALLGEAAMRGLLAWVWSLGKVTRCDLACDDWDRTVGTEDVWQAVLRGEHSTHARKIWETRELGQPPTVYFGKRPARQMLRVYDKGLESHGETDAVRWEIETHDEAAITLVGSLYKRNWGTVWASRLVTFVDFRDPLTSERMTRRERMAWFTRLVGDASKASAYPPGEPRTLEQVDEWLEKQTSPMLAVVFAARGGDVGEVEARIARGRARWRKRHHDLLEQSAAVRSLSERPIAGGRAYP